MAELKHCPFCGRQPYVQKCYTGQNKTSFSIKCRCGVLTHFKNRKYEAVDIWNRRFDSSARTGSWYGSGDGYADGELVYDVWNCSECDYCIDDGTDDPAQLPKFCPNCGAQMVGAASTIADV